MAELAPVPPLNHQIDISAEQATHLWYKSEMPPEPRDFQRRQARVSGDERWLIKRFEHPYGEEPLTVAQLSPDELCRAGLIELKRLQRLSLPVISHALVPAADSTFTIFVVSPYIPNLQTSSQDEFYRQNVPVLLSYLADRTEAAINAPGRSTFYMEDIFRHDQYSKHTGSERPFLHDIEPSLHTSAQHALKTLKQLASTAVKLAET
jgi:hypothetical protein